MGNRVINGRARAMISACLLAAALALYPISVSAAGRATLGGSGDPVKPWEAPLARTSPPASPAVVAEPHRRVQNIAPLYKEPKLAGEGIWITEDMPGGIDPEPLAHRTFYRPSERFPNAIVYMMLLNMRHISPKLYLGSEEPYRKGSVARVEDAKQPQLLAVTNALWQTRHAGRGGIILGGEVLKPMDPGIAAIIVYKDDSIDVCEWDNEIPVAAVRDARQLKHLIVNDGKVVTSIARRGQRHSAEIGLGSLLNEDLPVITEVGYPYGRPSQKLNFTSGDLWFIATRSGFGIRPDGDLVFAVGHHISTEDLAKALVLAGCVRAIHGDANPGNCVGVLYAGDGAGNIVKRVGLSPLQDKSTFDRYTKASYPKDFFAFFRRLHPEHGDESSAFLHK